MNNTFEQFVKEYTKSFGDDTKLVDSLKKQYEMYIAEEKVIENLCNMYNVGKDKIVREQLMPNDFGYLIVDNQTNSYKVEPDDFVFADMGLNNTFMTDVPSESIIEGICAGHVTGINIKNISFFIGDKCVHTVAGYQIKGLYYLESPIYIQTHERLIINVNLTAPCFRFPILFIGYKFCVVE